MKTRKSLEQEVVRLQTQLSQARARARRAEAALERAASHGGVHELRADLWRRRALEAGWEVASDG